MRLPETLFSKPIQIPMKAPQGIVCLVWLHGKVTDLPPVAFTRRMGALHCSLFQPVWYSVISNSISEKRDCEAIRNFKLAHILDNLAVEIAQRL